MALHRSLEADWTNLSSSEYNFWQRLAASTNGLITPANVITITGAVLVFIGLFMLVKDNYLAAFVFIVAGRLADILDGFVADFTLTKSPLGEAIDATTDKTIMCISLILVVILGDIPLAVGIILAFHTILNIGLFGNASKNNKRLHPTNLGKLAALLEWISLGLYILNDYLKTGHGQANITWLTATVVFIGFLPIAAISSNSYIKDLN